MSPLESEYADDEGVRYTLEVQPPSSRAVSIAGSYHCSWKPRSNHFQNYADFRPKGFHSQFLLSVVLINTELFYYMMHMLLNNDGRESVRTSIVTPLHDSCYLLSSPYVAIVDHYSTHQYE